MKLNSIFKIILPILIIAASIASFKYLKTSKTEHKTPETHEKVWHVATIDAQIEDLAADLTLYATIESPAFHAASAPASAIVEHVFVKAGSHVKKGDILVSLEQQDFINRVNEQKADILDIKAQLSQLNITHDSNLKSLTLEKKLLELSQSELNRVLSLKKRGLGSDSVLTDAKSALAKQQLSVLNKNKEVTQFDAKQQQLNAKLMRFKALLNQANLALKRSTITANFDGTISSVEIAQGDRVQASQKLISLYPNQQLEAKTRIPARFQQEIQNMLKNKQDVEASAFLDKNKITMQLVRMAGQSAANGTEVYFRITQGQENLRVGNFLKLSVKRAKQKNVIQLPLQSLYGTARIYILKEGRLKGLDIEPVGYYRAKNGQQQVLIRHPELKNGDKIVITHLPNAITGLKVKNSEK